MELSESENARLKELEDERDQLRGAEEFKRRCKLEDEFREKHNKILGGKITCGFGLPLGWYDLVGGLCEKLAPIVPDDFQVDQVKEKFGGLRFYYSNGNEEVDKLVREAEDKSYEICQDTGGPGKLRNDLNWMRTLCDELYKTEKEFMYLRDKAEAFAEDSQGFIWVDPNVKRMFSDNGFDGDKVIRLPTEDEYRSRYGHGYKIKDEDY